MKGVQCYELFGGIALKNHAFFIFYYISGRGGRGYGFRTTTLLKTVVCGKQGMLNVDIFPLRKLIVLWRSIYVDVIGLLLS